MIKKAFLCEHDVNAVLRALPTYVEALLRIVGKNSIDQLMLAGGFIRDVVIRDEPVDIDLFCPGDAEYWHRCILDCIKHCNVTVLEEIKTSRAITFKCSDGFSVQLIYGWPFPFTPEGREQLLSEFDFTICKVVLWCNVAESNRTMEICDSDFSGIADHRFYQDLANRRLRYACPETRANPAGSLWRVIKFVGRGYHITAVEFKALALMADPNDIDDSQGEY